MLGPTVATDVSLVTLWDGYLSLRALAAYSSLSERMLRSFLRDPDNPMPHYRVGDRVLVRRSEFDAWLTVYREPVATADADAIVKAMMGLTDGSGAPHRPRGVHRTARGA